MQAATAKTGAKGQNRPAFCSLLESYRMKQNQKLYRLTG